MTEPTDDALTEALNHQPALEGLEAVELPEYHGRKPVGMKSAVTIPASLMHRAHTVGDRAVLVVEIVFKAAGHEDNGKGLVYAERAAAVDLFELSAVQGSRILVGLRSLYREADDNKKGRRPLPDLGDVAHTDASGVVLTPAELAELRGDPSRAILSPELTPVVVVYNDGERLAWPDDYPADYPRPRVGDVFTADGSTVEVSKLLDHRTGETLPSPGAIADLPELANVATVAGHIPITDEAVDIILPGTVLDDGDEFAGDLGDGIEWSDKPADVATAEASDANALMDANAFMDCPLDELADKLGEVDDLELLDAYRIAEQAGRGRGAKARAGALNLVGSRVAFLADLDTEQNAADE